MGSSNRRNHIQSHSVLPVGCNNNVVGGTLCFRHDTDKDDKNTASALACCGKATNSFKKIINIKHRKRKCEQFNIRRKILEKKGR